MTRHQNIQPGQLWRSSDPRRFRIVRILAVLRNAQTDNTGLAWVRNIVTGRWSHIDLRHFCTGERGYSMEQETTLNRAIVLQEAA